MLDDIEKVITHAKKLQQFTGRPERIYAHKQSDLPASIDDMKQSIKDRIRTLAGAYISLASYVSDEDYKSLLNDEFDVEHTVYQKILTRTEVNRGELEDFNLLE